MLTKEDLAKYPSIELARKYVKQLNIDITTLADEFPDVISRAHQILREVITRGVYTYLASSIDTEILAFPVARLFIDAISDEWLFRKGLASFYRGKIMIRY